MKKLVIFILAIFICNSYSQTSWRNKGRGLGALISAMYAKDSLVLAAAHQGAIFVSLDYGYTWTVSEHYFDGIVFNFIISDNDSYFATNADNGILRSTDGGRNWKYVIESRGFRTLAKDNIGNLYACTDESSEIFKSTNDGEDWEEIFDTDITPWVSVYWSEKDSLLYASSFKYTSISSDYGETWSETIRDTSHKNYWRGIFEVEDTIYTCTQNHVYSSVDSGKTWRELPDYNSVVNLKYYYHLDKGLDNTFFASTLADAIVMSTNFGRDWIKLEDKFYDKIMDQTIALNNGDLLAASWANGIYKSTDGGKDWFLVNDGINLPYINSFRITETDEFRLITPNKIWKSSDYGTTWFEMNEGAGFRAGPSVYFTTSGPAEYVFSSEGIKRKLVSKNEWEPLHFFDERYTLHIIDYDGDDLAVTHLDGLYLSTDAGETWELTAEGPENILLYKGMVIRDTFYVTTYSAEVFRTEVLGRGWEEVTKNLNMQRGRVAGFVSPKTGIYIINIYNTGIYISRNNGESWENLNDGFDGEWANEIVATPDGKIVMSSHNGLFILNDEYKRWRKVGSKGMYGSRVTEIEFDQDGNIYLGTNLGLYKNTPDVLTGTDDEKPWEALVPREYSLTNYPNPFNPSTTINFTLPSAGEIKLELFDALGNKIKTLREGYCPAGSHEHMLDASGLSSGVYLYRLSLNGKKTYTETSKMLLLK